MKRFPLTIIAMVLLALPVQAAEDIKLVVPFPPGGATDVAARILAKGISEILGDNMIVVNMPGAGGTIAARHTSRSTPDGNTLVMGGSAPLSAVFFDKNIQVDYTLFDFQPVCGVARFQTTITVRANSPYNTFGDLLKAARSNPKKIDLAYGNPSQKSVPDLLAKRGNADFTAVPVSGEPSLLAGILGGHYTVGTLTVGAVISSLRAGSVRVLAVASEDRSELLPDVPTVAEAGLKEWVPHTSWVGILGPQGLNVAQATRIEKACIAVLSKPEVLQQIKQQGFEKMDPRYIPSRGFAAFLQQQLLTWHEISFAQ